MTVVENLGNSLENNSEHKISIRSRINKLPWITINQIASLVLLALIIWAIAYSLFADAVSPTSQMFGLAVVIFMTINI